MATPIAGKGIKAGQRTTRGMNEVAEGGSSLSSTGLDRAQFGAGSGAGALESAIQQSNDAQLNALGGVSNKLTNVNGALSDLNANMETLKKLETATLLFEFSKFSEFGKTFDGMDKTFGAFDKTFEAQENLAEKQKLQNDANFDELISRTEAGSRGIVKAITRLHGMLSGDSAKQLDQRLKNTSGEQTEGLMRARSVRDAQRQFLKDRGIYRIDSSNFGSNDDDYDNNRIDFIKTSRNASRGAKTAERYRAHEGHKVWKEEEQIKAERRALLKQYDKDGDWKSFKREDTIKRELGKRIKANRDYDELQLWDHGEQNTWNRTHNRLGGKTFGQADNKYSRDLNKNFAGGSGGGMDCCDDIVSALKDIEINTHVFREVREEMKKSYKVNALATREEKREASNAARNALIAEQNKNNRGLSKSGGALVGGARRAQGETIFAGSNMMPSVWEVGAAAVAVPMLAKKAMETRVVKYLKLGGKVLGAVALAIFVNDIYDRMTKGNQPFPSAFAGALVNFATFGMIDDFTLKWGTPTSQAAIDNSGTGYVIANGVRMSVDAAKKLIVENASKGIATKVDVQSGSPEAIQLQHVNTDNIISNAEKLKAAKFAKWEAEWAAEQARLQENANIINADQQLINSNNTSITNIYGGIDSTLSTRVPAEGLTYIDRN